MQLENYTSRWQLYDIIYHVPQQYQLTATSATESKLGIQHH